jgi:hypothetical protein
MEENKFWINLTALIVTCICTIAIVIAGYYGYIANRIAASSKPIETACAISSSSMSAKLDQTCITLMVDHGRK